MYCPEEFYQNANNDRCFLKRRQQSRQGSQITEEEPHQGIGQHYSTAKGSKPPRIASNIIPSHAHSVRLSMAMARSHTPVAIRNPPPLVIKAFSPMIPAPLNTSRSTVSNSDRITPLNGRSNTPVGRSTTPLPARSTTPLAPVPHDEPLIQIS
jgi:hypothetical protein